MWNSLCHCRPRAKAPFTDSTASIVPSGATAEVRSPSPTRSIAWWKVSALGFSVNASGWDTGALGKLVFLMALIAIALVIVDHQKIELSWLPVQVPLVLMGASILAVLFVLMRFVDTPDHVDWAWGLYLALIASLVTAYGAFMKVQEM